jgi:hypothetical protein
MVRDGVGSSNYSTCQKKDDRGSIGCFRKVLVVGRLCRGCRVCADDVALPSSCSPSNSVHFIVGVSK